MTRSKAKTRGIASAPSPSAGNPEVAFVDLGTEDAMTPSAEIDPVIIPSTPMDLHVEETAATAIGVHSTTPADRGNTKIQFCKVAHLEERLHVYEVLDRHQKEENVMLKERVAKLDQQLEDNKS